MKILNADQVREADAYTISHEPIKSIDLMERAAVKCFNWIINRFPANGSFMIFCGNGNNGGDGLAIARLLYLNGKNVVVYVSGDVQNYSTDFNINHKRLIELKSLKIKTIASAGDFPDIKTGTVIIDAIFGTGLNRIVEGNFAQWIDQINAAPAKVISIDIPSGLFPDKAFSNKTIKATNTLTFQFPKLSFFFPENSRNTGTVHILDIGLHNDFIDAASVKNFLLEAIDIRKMYKVRNPNTHKGNYGHALVIAGSYGKIGAAVLTSKACIRTGAGLVTAFLPKCGYQVMQTSTPEIMVMTDEAEKNISILPDITRYNVIGVGPGIGTSEETARVIKLLIQNFRAPMVFDADAINILSENKTWLSFVPHGSILTPHPGEFERLVGKWSDGFERQALQLAFSKKYNCYVVLKDHYTCISCPDGTSYFNATGNAGMATAGSGDVLTGMLTGLIAQGYAPRDAALTGVYLHGLSGDLAAEKRSMESIIASDIIENIGYAFLQIANHS